MTFTVREHDEPIKWPVHVSVPKNGGAVQRCTFTGHFLVLDSDQLIELEGKDDKDYIARILVGWEEDLKALDEDGRETPIPFNDETRNQLAKISYIKTAILDAYWALLAGRQVKN